MVLEAFLKKISNQIASPICSYGNKLNEQNEVKMFAEKIKNKLFQIVSVAHGSNCGCFSFNKKHLSVP